MSDLAGADGRRGTVDRGVGVLAFEDVAAPADATSASDGGASGLAQKAGAYLPEPQWTRMEAKLVTTVPGPAEIEIEVGGRGVIGQCTWIDDVSLTFTP